MIIYPIPYRLIFVSTTPAHHHLEPISCHMASRIRLTFVPDHSRTPSPAPNLSISSVKNSPSKSTEALQKNAGSLTPELQHNLKRLVHHNRLAIDHLTMANDTIMRIMAGEQLINRPNNKRQFNEVNNNSMLKIRNANSSIAARKAREDAPDEWFAKGV